MFRALLVVAVIAIGYDAVVHHGAYTRSAWTNAVELTDRAVDGARRVGDPPREEPRPQQN